MTDRGSDVEVCQWEEGCRFPLPDVPAGGPEGVAFWLFQRSIRQFEQMETADGIIPFALLWDQFESKARGFGIPWEPRIIAALEVIETHYCEARRRRSALQTKGGQHDEPTSAAADVN